MSKYYNDLKKYKSEYGSAYGGGGGGGRVYTPLLPKPVVQKITTKINIEMDVETLDDLIHLGKKVGTEFKLKPYIEYNIDLTMIHDLLPEMEDLNAMIGQEEFKQELIDRYGKKCILTGCDTFDACHIIPFSDSENMDPDNGLLLNPTHHRMFDNYEWSINPNTLQIEINYSKADQTDFFSQIIDGKKLKQIEQYKGVIKYLNSHYDKFNSKTNSKTNSD